MRTKEKLWLQARVTDSEPTNGELVGLTILNIDTGHPKVDHAIFKPLKPTTHWDERLTGESPRKTPGSTCHSASTSRKSNT